MDQILALWKARDKSNDLLTGGIYSLCDQEMSLERDLTRETSSGKGSP